MTFRCEARARLFLDIHLEADTLYLLDWRSVARAMTWFEGDDDLISKINRLAVPPHLRTDPVTE